MDKNKVIPIQLMCSISTTGEFTPIRFRFRSDEGELTTVDVIEVLRRESNELTTGVLVSGFYYNELRQFQLIMSNFQHIWRLVRIV